MTVDYRQPSKSRRRYQPLLVVLGAVCPGILIDRYVGLGLTVWWGLAAASGLGWVVLWRLRKDRAACVLLLLAAGAAMGGWHHLWWSRFEANDLGCFTRDTAQPVCVEARVVKGSRRLPAVEYDPMRIMPQSDRTQLELWVERIRDGTDWRPASGRATLLVEGHLLDVHAGDRVRVFGQLTAPRTAHNPGEFDRAEYLRGNRVRATLRAECPQCVTMIARGGPWRPRRWLERVQDGASGVLWRQLNSRHAGLGSALLLGTREDLGPTQSMAFLETGMAHLLAISGLNVGIVVLVMAWVLRFLRVPHVPAIVLVAATAVSYAILTGSQPPVVRAAILVVVLLVGVVSGRHPARFNSLAAAGLIILALNPTDLFRVGTQLSFLAVAVLMWIAPNWIGSWKSNPPLERLIKANRPWWRRWTRSFLCRTWNIIVVSGAVWLVVSPLVAAHFHLISPIAILLNAFLLIPITVALCSGFAVILLGWLIPPLGVAIGWVCNVNLAFVDWMISLAQKFPPGHFWAPGPAEWWLWGFYGGLFLVAVAGRWRPPRRWIAALAVGWIGVGLLCGCWDGRSRRLECTFLAVGHGLAVLIELPDGGTVLYDAGSLGEPETVARSIAGCLWEKGITRIDAVVVSHADADHYNALPGLLRRFRVGAVYVSPEMPLDRNQSLAALHEAIVTAGVPIRELDADDRLVDAAGCTVEVLHPARHDSPVSDNATSVVLLVEYAGRRILLPGDLELSGLDDLLAEEPIDCDVLLVPHHGSRQSSPPGLIAWSRPEAAVVSGSLARDPEATEAAYREAGVRVLHTGREGAVGVGVGGRGTGDGAVEVWGFRD